MEQNESVFDDDLDGQRKEPPVNKPPAVTAADKTAVAPGAAEPINEMEAIRARMEQLAAKAVQQQGKPLTQSQAAKLAEVDFLGAIDPEVGVQPDQLKSGFSKLHQTVVSDTDRMISEKLAAVESNIQTFVTGLIMGEKFFEINPDLRKYRAFVGMKWDEVVKSNPNIGYDELFTKLEEVSRKELNLAKGKDGNNKPAPALAKQQSVARPGTQKASGLRAELDELHPFRR